MRFRRTITSTALAVLALGALTACQSKAGLAAAADSHRLSNSDLATYVQPGAKPYTDQSSGEPVIPKVYALENWIDYKLFAAAVAHNGGEATGGELSAARTAVLGTHTEADYVNVYRKMGYTDSFADLILDQSSMLVVLVERLAHVSPANAIQLLQSSSAGPQLLKAVNAADPQVVVSRRWGTWDPTTLSLSSDPAAGLPSFVEYSGAKSSSSPSASG